MNKFTNRVCIVFYCNVCKYSLRVLWVSLIASDLLTAFENASITKAKVVPSFIGIGASTCIASNIFQLGSDQMFDASSSQITSFIDWQLWAFSFVNGITFILSYCFCGLYADSISLLIPRYCLLSSVICDCFLCKWIVRICQNKPNETDLSSFEVCSKNQIPRLRSAIPTGKAIVV